MVDWSKAPPSAPGHYVVRDVSGEEKVVHVILGLGGLRVSVPGVPGDAALDRLVVPGAEWRGPLPAPEAWRYGEPSEPGWYWAKGPKRVATVVHLLRPWGDEPALWAAEPGKGERPLRRAGLADCVWAGPLEL